MYYYVYSKYHSAGLSTTLPHWAKRPFIGYSKLSIPFLRRIAIRFADPLIEKMVNRPARRKICPPPETIWLTPLHTRFAHLAHQPLKEAGPSLHITGRNTVAKKRQATWIEFLHCLKGNALLFHLRKQHRFARQLIQSVRKISPAITSGQTQNRTKQCTPQKSPIHNIN